MSNLKERLQQIKDDYSKEKGYEHWEDLVYKKPHLEKSLDEICKRFAEEVIKEASERAEILTEIRTHKADGIRRSGGSWRETSVDKQSILKLIDEL